MLLVYAEDERDALAIRARVPQDLSLDTQRTWADFERAAPTATGLLVVASLDHDSILTERLRRVQTENPGHSLVLVTAPPSGDVRVLQRVVADAVLWRNQLDQELWPTLATAHGRCARRRGARTIRGAAHLPTRLRYALAAALDAAPPPSTVAALAALARCHRATLGSQWRRSVCRPGALRLEDFVGWLVLLHAVGHKRHDQKWSAAAEGCAVHLHTLRRLARRLMGCGLGALEGARQQDMYERFDAECLQVVVPRTPGSVAWVLPLVWALV